jgi:AraC-like DNA-binding protein
MNVKAIAAQLGYEDPLYFSRIFSKTIGMSPRSYRASIRK